MSLVWYIVCTYTDFPSLFTDVFNDLNLRIKKNDFKKYSSGLVAPSPPGSSLTPDTSWSSCMN